MTGPAEPTKPVEPAGTPEPPGSAEPPASPVSSVGRASGVMALGTIASRVTGFLRQAVLAAAIGSGLVNDAYTVANTLPNIVYELLLGGVLSSVVVPLLVKARRRDPDGGLAYEQRLITLAVIVLGAATLLAVAAAPLLTTLYSGQAGPDTRRLTTLLAYLVLPEIFFYGVGALLGAVLNTRGHFAAPMWAPVVNNLVVIVTAAVFVALPGPGRLSPATITGSQLLVLGVGTTLGIVAQTLALWPALRRVGFAWRPRTDFRHAGLGEARTLAAWIVGYVVVSQLAVVVITNLAAAAGRRGGPGMAIYNNAYLLFMLPHGIVAVSVITALLPRMSRAAVDGRHRAIAADLALGTRLSGAVLLPVGALLLVLGAPLATLVFAHGQTDTAQGRATGVAVAVSALGLFPFAVSQLQVFVFYALRDARTPVLVNVVAVAVRIGFDLLAYRLVPAADVVAAMMLGNSVSYVVAAALGYWLLHRRIGTLGLPAVLRSAGRLAAASVPAALAAGALVAGAVRLGGPLAAGSVGYLGQVAAGGLVGGLVFLLAARLLGAPEPAEIAGQLGGQLGGRFRRRVAG